MRRATDSVGRPDTLTPDTPASTMGVIDAAPSRGFPMIRLVVLVASAEQHLPERGAYENFTPRVSHSAVRSPVPARSRVGAGAVRALLADH